VLNYVFRAARYYPLLRFAFLFSLRFSAPAFGLRLSPPALLSPANPIWQKCLMPLGPESVVKCDVPLLNYLFFWILAYASSFLFERDKTGCWVCPGRGSETRKTASLLTLTSNTNITSGRCLAITWHLNTTKLTLLQNNVLNTMICISFLFLSFIPSKLMHILIS
jgi:hypothetical protein